jgi:uncharacterized cofD-like protein
MGLARSRVVVVGGGRGEAVTIRALAALGADIHAAVVATHADRCPGDPLAAPGGRLLPEDLRSCLAALARDELRSSWLDERDDAGTESGERVVGASLLAALCRTSGDLQGACDRASSWLETRGRVVPASLTPLALQARNLAGERMAGERAIAGSRSRIIHLEAAPGAAPNPLAAEVIAEADAVVLGPGSFHVDVLGCLAAPGVAQALASTAAKVVWVANPADEGPRTQGMSLPCHVRALRDHVARWASEPLRELTVLAHGDRFTRSAIDRDTPLRRAPLVSFRGASSKVAALAAALAEVLATRQPSTRRHMAAV